MYTPESLIELKGKKYHSKRNFINGFTTPYEFRSYNENDREKDSVCENLYESVIAGLYLDGGIEVAKKFICKTILTEKIEKGQDAKSELQIYCQKNKLGIIEYKVLSKSGPDHAPTFKVGVYLGKEKIAEAVGSKKSIAEQAGAKQALNNLKRRK